MVSRIRVVLEVGVMWAASGRASSSGTSASRSAPATAVGEAYAQAMRQVLYPPAAYLSANVQEYWTKSTQAWFDAAARTDVNGGVDTRVELRAHDPALSAILESVYGITEIPHRLGCSH